MKQKIVSQLYKTGAVVIHEVESDEYRLKVYKQSLD